VAKEFDNHDMVIRLRIEGGVAEETFYGWLTTEAEARNLDGWTRIRDDGSADTLIAGDVGPVMELLDIFTSGDCPGALSAVVERPLRGDEPIWHGFHFIPGQNP